MGEVTDEFFPERIFLSELFDVAHLFVGPLDDFVQTLSFFARFARGVNSRNCLGKHFYPPRDQRFHRPFDDDERSSLRQQTRQKSQGPEVQSIQGLEQDIRCNPTQDSEDW